MLKPSSLATWGAAVLLLSSLSSCEDILEQYFPKPNPTPPSVPTFPPLGQDISFYALAGGTRLDAYSTANAATRTSSVAITGLGSGETLLAIDFRPATGQLYGVSSASRLYVLNQNTGVARAIGTGAFTPAVAGNLVGFDFNPTVDRIRLVTSTGQNLRLNPETGAVANTDGVLNGAAGATITGAAYTNNVAGASTTVLYNLDPATDRLLRQDPPNNGTLVPVGALNLNITGEGGFDIDAKTGTALGLYPVNGNPTLFAVDLTTGSARALAQYSASAAYSGLAIPTQPVAYAVGLVSAGGLNIFNPMSPATVVTKPITGLDPLDRILGIDFRPATGQLYALVGRDRGTSTGLTGFAQLFTINPATGEATVVVRVSASILDAPYGFDFDPVTDEIRTTASVNLRINPTTGVAVREADLTPGSPSLSGLAYTNNVAGATTTMLYGLGSTFVTGGRNLRLYRLNQPNTGLVEVVGSVGTNDNFSAPYVESFNGFDIGGISNTAYAFGSVRNGEFSREYLNRIYTINLTTGRATAIGDVGNIPIFPVTGFTVGLGF